MRCWRCRCLRIQTSQMACFEFSSPLPSGTPPTRSQQTCLLTSACALPKCAGKLTIVGLVALDETPTVDVNDHASATALASQQIETADSLAEGFHDISCIPFFVRRELGDESGFLSIRISPDETIYDWRLSGFGVSKIRPDGIYLDILGYVVSILFARVSVWG